MNDDGVLRARMGHDWQDRMVAALLEMRSLTDRQGRALLVELVGESLARRPVLREQPTVQLQLLELVRSCVQIQDGPSQLARAVRLIESDSIAVRKVEQLVGELNSAATESAAAPSPAPADGQAKDSAADEPVKHFFVSYTGVDETWATWISWELEAAGYNVMVQAWDFVVGSNWHATMQKSVTECERTIALVSPAYLKSVYGQLEWQSAQSADPTGLARKLIPIRIAPCTLPGLLSGVVAFDLYGLTSDQARERLLKQIGVSRAGRGKPGLPPAFPG